MKVWNVWLEHIYIVLVDYLVIKEQLVVCMVFLFIILSCLSFASSGIADLFGWTGMRGSCDILIYIDAEKAMKGK